METRYRVMVEGEDHSVWCEKNNLTREQAYECGGTIHTMYEGAHWWLEIETPVNTFQDDPYGWDEDEDEGVW